MSYAQIQSLALKILPTTFLDTATLWDFIHGLKWQTHVVQHNI